MKMHPPSRTISSALILVSEIDHYDLLEVMTPNAATGLGVGATMIGQQIKSINSTLKELEVLHQDTFRKHDSLNHSEFFDQRQRLFTKLDFAL